MRRASSGRDGMGQGWYVRVPMVALGLACQVGIFSAFGCRARTPASGSGAGAGLHVRGTPHPDELVKAWRGAGLPVDGFVALAPPPYGGAYCEEGRVDAIDTMICEYPDTAALERGKTSLVEQWGREGGHTVAAVQAKLTLLGMCDRALRDPNGRTISKAIETFRKL